MVYAFECERCQIRVYSATPKRARGCPLCAEPMQGEPLVGRTDEGAPETPVSVDVPAGGPAAAGEVV